MAMKLGQKHATHHGKPSIKKSTPDTKSEHKVKVSVSPYPGMK